MPETGHRLRVHEALVFLFLSALITGFAFLAGEYMESLERAFSGQLMAILSGVSRDEAMKFLSGSEQAAPARLILDTIFTAVAIIAGSKLGTVGKNIVSLQLIAVAILIQGTSIIHGLPLANPISLAMASLLGMLGGTFIRAAAENERLMEAQRIEIGMRSRQLEESRLQMIKSDEVERRTLAADLHDQVLQDLKLLRQRLKDYQEKPDGKLAYEIDALVTTSMTDIREVMDALSPSAIDHLGLIAAIEDCVRRGAERAGYRTRFKSELERDWETTLSPVEQALIYRLVQESINNICKHAGAKKVVARLKREGGAATITIIDDGKGFDRSEVPTESRGLSYMKLRANIIGADINWRKGDDSRGTAVEIVIPERHT